MEKQVAIDHHQEQHNQHPKQQALKCPRCDSLNTKFCYYNNYSLSQPRHFCKACKRYWTRGGTLRNVPVGGGCRKNKKVKIAPITTTTTTTSNSVQFDRNPNPNLDHFPSLAMSNNNSNHHLNPLFYGLVPQNPSNYPRFDDRVPSGYDFSQPHMNETRLGFSSADPGPSVVVNHSQNSSSFLSCYPSSVFVRSTFSSTSASTMASILASGQQRFMDWNNNHQGQKNDDQIEAIGSSDPASLLWNTTDGGSGGWFDPTSNNGSSVPSFI